MLMQCSSRLPLFVDARLEQLSSLVGRLGALRRDFLPAFLEVEHDEMSIALVLWVVSASSERVGKASRGQRTL